MRKQRGFTLIELLVVIAIIGLLSTLAVVALNSARQKARDAKRVADVKQVQTALELHFNDEASYPAGTALALGAGSGINDCTDAAGAAPCDTISSDNGIDADAAGTTYMALIPRDPSAATSGTIPECDASATAVCHYSYSRVDVGSGTGNGYEIWFFLEAATGGLATDENCATEAGIGATCTH